MSGHLYTTSIDEFNNASSEYADEGIACYVYDRPQARTIPMFRFNKGDDYIFTSSAEGFNNILLNGYNFEGVAFYAYSRALTKVDDTILVTETERTVPLYSLYADEHFYTISLDEVLAANASGWKVEGIACYVFSKQVQGTVPLHRLNKP